MRTSLLLILPSALALLLTGCEDLGKSSDTTATGPGTNPTDTGLTTDTGTPGPGPGSTDDTETIEPPTGDGVLSFEVVWGGEPPLAFQGSTWQSIIDLNLYSPTEHAFREHAVVLMLCEVDDATCTDPVLIREVAAGETSDDPIQSSFGPDISVGGLPEGEYNVMVFVDSGVSRAKGYAWDDGFDTTEQAWGGVVSELDAMHSADVQAAGVNPPPAALLIDISAAGTDLGTLEMQHFHQRDVSPEVPLADGTMVVATQEGLRLVDLSTYEVEEAAGFAGSAYQMLTADFSPVDGQACGLVDAGDGLVWVLYDGYGVTDFAIPFDVNTRAQAANYHRVTLPGGATPCRGVAGVIDGRPHLLVTDAAASRLAEVEAGGSEGLWLVDVSDIDSRDITAQQMDRNDEAILQAGVDDMAIHSDRVYLSISPTTTDTFAPEDCRGFHCVYDATPGDAWSYAVALEQSDVFVTDSGTVACSTENPWAGIHATTFHDGRDLLFLGGCTQIVVMDLATMSPIDLDGDLLGQQNLDATLFGQGYNAFSESPSGTLWALPQEKSPIHFYIQKGHDDPNDRQTFNRYMVLPIDLTTGAEPGVHADYTGGDLDDYTGLTDIGPYTTPAADPGVDLNFATSVVYQMFWLPSTAGSTFQSASFPIGPSLAATDDVLWVRGSGVAGVSGLGKAGDLEVIDLASRSPLLFPWRDGEAFYPYWEGGPGGAEKTGFDITPESEDESETVGLVFVP